MKESLMRIASKFIRQKYVYAGVPVIIRNSKGEILLGKRSRKVVSFPGVWGLPGGMPNYGEKLADAAKREIKEELGVDVEIIKVSRNFYEDLPNKESRFHNVAIPHFARIVGGFLKPQDETSEIRWFKPSEIRGMKLAYTHKEILKGEGLI